MKFNIWKYAVAALVGIAALASCDEPAPEVKVPDPVFPETVITKTVAAGESVNLNISPNLAWEVSISGEGSGTEFWLDDDGMKKSKISSKETGSVVITVIFAADDKFDVNRVCKVNLTMADQTKEIAVLTLPAINRTCDIYAGVVGEDSFTEDFGSDKVTDVSLVTFRGINEYVLPLRVVTNFPWQIAADSWLKVTSNDKVNTPVNSGEVGATDILVTAVLSTRNMNGAEGVLKFIDVDNPEASYELKVTLPAFVDRVEMDLLTTLNFDAAGSVMNLNDTYMEGLPAIIDIMATEATTVKVIEWFDDYQYHDIKFADWAFVTKTLYDTYSAEDALARYTVEISVAENIQTSKRYADVFMIPASKSNVSMDDWFDPNTGNLKEEFEKLIIGRIIQEAKEEEVEIETTPAFTLASGTAEFKKLGEENELAMFLCSELNITEVYELKTKKKVVAISVEKLAEWSAKEMEHLPPFSPRENPLFHVEPSFDETAGISTFMITTEENKAAEAIVVLQTLGVDEVTMVNYAAFHVIYDPEASIAVPSPFTFADPDAAKGKAEIFQCTGKALETVLTQQYGIAAESVWMLKYTDASASELIINVPGTPFGDSAYNSVNPNTGAPIADYWLTNIMVSSKQMKISMSKKSSETDYFVWMDRLYNPQCALVCTYEPAN